jgi:vacuolar-type H+-ATPase subunit B/Vma2
MELLQYFVINGLAAKYINPKQGTLPSLSLENEYVIENYKTPVDKNGNSHYKYKIYKNEVEQSYIAIDKWKITNLRTYYSFRPKTIFVK